MATITSHLPAPAVVETAPRGALAELQLSRLRMTLARREIDNPVPTLADVRALPFTTKDDLRAAYPLAMMTTRSLVRLHASSGTSGTPTIVGHTRRDLDTWAQLVARSLATAGVRPGMVVHNAYPYGLTTGGFGFQQGAERLGATVVPAAGAPLDVQARLIFDLGTQVLCAAPSFAAQLADVLPESQLELGLFGGELWTPALGARLQDTLGLRPINTYGLSEIVGPGVATECPWRCGMHVNEDHFLVEVIHPVTAEPLPDDTLGELVITTLTREAMPLIRYRTGDLSSVTTEPCACGRTTMRIRSLLGRRADALSVRGRRVFPSQIEQVLLEQPGVGSNYQLVAEPEDVVVFCEPLTPSTDHVALAGQVRAALHDRLGLELPVEVVAHGVIPRSPGKAVRVVHA